MDIHVYIHNNEEKLIKKVNKIMASVEQLTTVIQAISGEVDKVSADTDNLLNQLSNIPTNGLSPEQQAALDAAVASAEQIVARLQSLDERVPEVQ